MHCSLGMHSQYSISGFMQIFYLSSSYFHAHYKVPDQELEEFRREESHADSFTRDSAGIDSDHWCDFFFIHQCWLARESMRRCSDGVKRRDTRRILPVVVTPLCSRKVCTMKVTHIFIFPITNTESMSHCDDRVKGHTEPLARSYRCQIAVFLQFVP